MVFGLMELRVAWRSEQVLGMDVGKEIVQGYSRIKHQNGAGFIKEKDKERFNGQTDIMHRKGQYFD